MNTMKKFEKWVKDSIKFRLIFRKYEDCYVVTNGYTAFKISSSNTKILDILKQQTFQTLSEDFNINERKINLKVFNSSNFYSLFDLTNKKIANKTNFIYEDLFKTRIFNVEGINIFINEEYLKYINMSELDIYGGTDLEPIIFHSDELDYLVFPVRILKFPYEIKIKQIKENE